MAHIDTGGSGRSKHIEPNLVPFIDLMSVLITFLLITAVWSQASMIQIGSSLYGKKSDDNQVETPTQANLVLKLEVKDEGYVLTMGTQMLSIPKKDSDYDSPLLLEQLAKFKTLNPEKTDGVIAVSDSVKYNNLIVAMDILLKAGFPAISVATGGPK